ncbi:DNA translocase FtsK [Halomonas campisalis]|uniref:DNA translocase FtsK n=1 Tax=Billgrantia campisalis TaxID=74661 RepID=A0ABS9P6G1_9GAMM|nr:DNA translocase FtsK 4TM domain-containing protein [Halomonas campisalis]MCG6657364.1 DNA translocase FtsK [Halomonas campisalis]MDR5863291.1 DNA translocase FtsK 4TM domain-containing protein [Halomonas campisalis]
MGLRLQGAAREGVVIVLLAACVFLLLALFSYQAADPGWSHRGPETDVANWMGPIGAWLADVLYSLFGASALWWPGMLGFAGWWLIRSRRVRFEWDATAVAVRLGGLVLLLLGTTTLGALHFYHPDSVLPYSSGGILGEGLVGALVPLVGPGGTGLLALAAMLCGFPLFSGLSWLSVMDELGHRALRLWGWFAVPFGLARERREARQAEAPDDKAEVGESLDGGEYEPPPQRGWRRLLSWRRGEAMSSPAAGAARFEPGFGDDGKTEIPWDVPERTPSAKRPEAAYTAQQDAAGAAASESAGRAPLSSAPRSPEPPPASPLSARRDEPETPSAAMPLSAKEPEAGAPGDEEPARESAQARPATEPLVADRDGAPQDAESDDAGEAQEAPWRAEAAALFSPPEPAVPDEPEAVPTPAEPPRTSRREPGLGDWHPTEPAEGGQREPRLSWDAVADATEEERAETAAASTQLPEREAPESGAPEGPSHRFEAADQAAGLREWRTQGSEPEVDSPRVASAEQGRAAAAEPEGPALWTVEHLQSQRPQLDDLPEPDGELPSLRLLTPPEPHQRNYTDAQLAEMAELLETRLREYGVKAEVVNTWPGPVITRFEIKPAAGVKVSKISNLAKDLARSLMVKSVRVVEVIPGRPTVGIEIPNPHRAMIRLREVIDSDRYQHEASALTLALGQDIGGGAVVANLGKMPHLLVAGTTGSGKSVGVNAMLISMLLKATPDELRLIMVDPKMLELSVYDGIPHLLAPVVTDMKEAANALRWCVAEMERRYKLMAAMGVRNIAGFNAKLDEAEQAGAQVADPLWEPQPWEMHQTPPVLEKLPYIVVVIDEFADMFMIVGKKVEELIARLAQKARAAGIHLILATQRPSVDVVTGLIKANIPTRMAFQVSSRVDSRTILDQGGAENLLGHGDMLYLPAGSGLPTRVHGAFVDDDEVHRVVEDWKRRGEPDYIEEILSGGVSAEALTGLEAEGSDGGDAEQDALYDEAVQFVTESRRASISAVQRRFKIGYNRAARLVEAMEMAGVVSTMGTNGAREVLAPPPVGD